MAASTGLVLATGAIAITDTVLGTWSTERALMIATGTVVAAVVAAGLDKVIPGFGTGTAVVLCLSAVLLYGPPIASKINLTPTPGAAK